MAPIRLKRPDFQAMNGIACVYVLQSNTYFVKLNLIETALAVPNICDADHQTGALINQAAKPSIKLATR